MKTLTLRFLGIFIGFSFLYSCTDDYFEFDEISTAEWRPELAIPLVKASLSLNDIVVGADSTGLIQENENGVFELVYDGRVFSTPGGDLIDLPSQTLDEVVGSATVIPPSPSAGNRTENYSTEFSFDNNGTDLEIDSILLNEGFLSLNVENEFEYDIEVDVTFRNFINTNGDTLKLSYIVPAATTPNGVSVRSKPNLPLAGYTLNMTEDVDGNPTVNTIPVDMTVKFDIPPNTGSRAGDKIRLRGSLNRLDFKEFSGYVGKQDLLLEEDSINVNLFNNFVDANFFLSNPLIRITITNSFGIPADLTFDKLKALNPDEAQSELKIKLPPSAKPIDLEYPDGVGAEESVVTLDTLNSNVDDVISFLLQDIIYEASTVFNPNEDKTLRNFVTDTSKLSLDVFLKIPFSGYSTGFQVIDTIDFEFEGVDEIDEGILKVVTSNGFPIQGELQVVFTDSAFNQIEVLFKQGSEVVIEPAFVDAAGDVIGKRDVIKTFDISREQLSNLSKSKFALMKVEFSSVNAASQEVVSFRPGYEVDVAIGLKAKILID